MCLLTHYSLSLAATWISTWLVRFLIGVARPCAAAVNRLSGWPPLTMRLRDAERVHVEALVVRSAFCSALATADLQRLRDLLGRQLLVELEDGVGLVHILAADEIDDEPHLPGRLAHQPLNRMSAHGYSGFAFLSATSLPLCPRNSRVGANSPSLWPTMFSVTYTGTNLFPLCTAKVWPTNSGRIVLARLQVLTTFFSFRC